MLLMGSLHQNKHLNKLLHRNCPTLQGPVDRQTVTLWPHRLCCRSVSTLPCVRLSPTLPLTAGLLVRAALPAVVVGWCQCRLTASPSACCWVQAALGASTQVSPHHRGEGGSGLGSCISMPQCTALAASHDDGSAALMITIVRQHRMMAQCIHVAHHVQQRLFCWTLCLLLYSHEHVLVHVCCCYPVRHVAGCACGREDHQPFCRGRHAHQQ